MSWLKRPLRDLVTAHYGKALKKENRDENGDNQVFGSAGFVGNHNESLVHSQTIIVGRKGSVGKVIWAPDGGWIIDTAYYLTLNESEQLDWRYLYYALSVARLEKKTITTSIPGLNRDDFYDTEIPLPPLDEQKRIAAILDKADAIRQKRKQAIDLADEFLRSVFLDMFGDPVTNPKGWEVKTFGSVIDTLTDYHANGSYKTLNENVTLLDEPNYAYMVRTTDLEKRNYVDGVKYIDKHAYEHLSKSKVFGGEIIVNKIGSAGALYLMPKLNRPVSLAMNQFMVRCKEGHLNEFYFHQLCTNAGTSEIQKRVQGAVTKTITKNALREVPVMCPSEEKQQGFVKIVEAFNSNLLCDLKEAYRASCEAFDSLSLKAFSGQL
ncbi:restriction endonuclease subunit S [Vibrio cincinnatiensis]|uniref:Restriction endonuclease subunit S n=1 Tax=Vibrio metschnikovii TaxID=28172 RepID=A0A9X0R726_VIBME|nr:restriction endonuclease subunit S [Vibrio metschnikovii]MBC5850662.1 restriction endonuclease subunit S [Vibrio metschnikovii]